MKIELPRGTSGMGLRVVVILGLVGLLWLLLGLQNDLVGERQASRDGAVSRTVAEWGGEQRWVGPFLRVPYRETLGKGNEVRIRESFAYRLPDEFAVKADLKDETRQRGIYPIPLYRASLEVTGSFDLKDLDWFPEGARPDWSRVEVWYFVRGARGLDQRPSVNWDGQSRDSVRAPLGESGSGLDAFSFPVELASQTAVGFRMSVVLKGGSSFGVFPAGQESLIDIRSEGRSEFGGDYLPSSRTVTDTNFNAQWRIPALARSLPPLGTAEEWGAVLASLPYASFDLTPSLDSYRLIDRALKYGLLFIIVPFVGLFLFEVFSRQRLHPVQYLLVGLAVSLFYLLLLSLSERLPFAAAFLVGALAVCTLLGVYASAVLRTLANGLWALVALAGLYGLLYLIIVSEDNALLVGTFFLFALLSVVMVTTRNIDWYRLGSGSKTGPA